MEQLIIVIMILLFTGGDLLVRWLKKRDAAGKAAPARGGRPVAAEEDEVDEEPWFEVLEEDEERFAPPVHFPRPVIVRDPPPTEPAWVTHTPSPAPLAPKAVLPAVLPATQPVVARPTGARTRGIPAHDWIRNRRDARRGIVLMTILGTPRGLE